MRKIYAFSQEKEVMEFVSLPKKSPERKAITTKLRNRGNLKHNVKTFQSGTGLLIAAKGTKKKGAVNNKKKTTQIEKKYSLCVACEGTYVRDSYYRHRCVQFESKKSELGTDAVKAKPSPIKAGDAYLATAIRGVPKEASDLLSSMYDDEIGLAVKHDELAVGILEYVLKKEEGHQPNWRKNICYRLRLLGRFLLEARELLPSCHSLREILQPFNFLQIVTAAQRCAIKEKDNFPVQDDAEETETEANSVPVKIGFMLKLAIKVVVADEMMLPNFSQEKVTSANYLIELFKLQWGTR
jgi:hypothetical protein